MTQLLTYDQSQMLDKLLETETHDNVMFIRYDRNYEAMYPALFEIEPLDLMRALSTGYIAYVTPADKWRERHRLSTANARFLHSLGDADFSAKETLRAEVIAEMDADFKLGIIEMGAE